MENPTEIPMEYLKKGEIRRENTPPIDVETLGKEKLDSLKEAIQEIKTMIREREQLSTDFVRQGERMKMEINNFLSESAPIGEDDSDFARERAELRKKQIEISESQQKEKLNCWKDKAELKKELREKEKELHEKTSRAEMLGKILEE